MTTKKEWDTLMGMVQFLFDKQMKRATPTLLPASKPSSPAPVYQADMERFGGPEEFARQIRQREPGWRDSLKLIEGCFLDTEPKRKMIAAFKDAYPQHFSEKHKK